MPTRERPKSPEVQTPGNTPTRKQQSIKPSIAKRNIEQRRQPGNVYVPKKKTPPHGVQPAGVNSLVAPGFASNTVSGAANIVELARALKNDVDLIFEFVHNNIDFIPTFGSQKGGLGALIDGMGNAFDQSELMIELLREAGYTCSFQNGEVEITEAVAMNWLGTDGIWSSSNLLGTCGIPNETYWTGSEWKLRVSHCWVQVDISGTDYVFDPALKTYTNIAASIDLATALDYDRTDFMNDATSGATITSDYVEDMNRTNVRDNLATMTGNLVDYLRTNAPTATLDDVLGGRTINPVSGPVRQTSLPYLRPSTTPDTWSDIPNAYKATLGVFYDDGLNIDVSFYSKDIHGKRLTLTFNASHECELRLDGDLVATSAPQGPDSWNSVYLSITHPYANVWWDQGFWQTLWEGHPYMIAQAWGNAGRQMVEVHREKLSQSLFDGDAPTDENVIGETLAVWFNMWNAQKSWACDIFNRMTNCRTVLQHQIGLVGHFDTPTMDLGGIMWSTYCLENDEWPDPIDTNDTALAMHGIAFEAGSIEQICGVGGISTTTIIDKAVQDGLKIYDGRIDNWTSDVRPNLTNYDSGTLDFIYNAYINVMEPWRVALPEDGQITKNDFIGYGFYAISPWYGAIGIFSGYLQGGMGDEILSSSTMTENAESNGTTGGYGSEGNGGPPASSSNNAGGLTAGSSADPVYFATGAFTYDHIDLTVGSGTFPYQLSFQRFYRSNSRLVDGSLGLGWSHNHEIKVSVSSDGLTGMSTLNPVQGAAGLAAMFVTVDLYRDLGKPLDKWVTVAMVNRWMLDQLTDNVVDVTSPEMTQRFLKLPNGSFVSPLGSANVLTENAGLFTLITPQGLEHNFNSDGNIETVVFPSGVTITYTYSAGKLQAVTNGMDRTLTLTYVGDKLSSVSDGNSRSASFTLDLDGNLAIATDPEGEDTTFEYDQPGRMTKIFKPANPTDEVVSNSYDSLNRVKEQADAYGNVTKFYIAGPRCEVVDPDDNSEVRNFDAFGNIVKLEDKSGKIWLSEFDGLRRLIKTSAPEGNSTEYEYDNMNNVTLITRIPKAGSSLDDIVTSHAFDSVWNKVASVSNPRGMITTFTYDPTTGNLLKIEQPEVDGKVPSIEQRWNERGQLISKIDQTGIQSQFEYDSLSEVLLTSVNNTNWLATLSGLPTVSDVLTLTVTDASIAGGTKSKIYTVQSGDTLYDVAQGLGDAINADSELEGLGIRAKVFNSVLSLSTAVGNSTTFSQSTSGGATEVVTLEAGLNLTTTFSYDEVGNVSVVTDPRGNQLSYEYDKLRRGTKAISAEPFEYETKFTYDANGNRTIVQKYAGLDEFDDPVWQTLTATYTIDDQLEIVTDSGNNQTQFAYDSRRKLSTTEDAENRITTRLYDPAGRIAGIVGPDSVIQAIYSYTDNGRMATIEDASENVTELTYDGFDRPYKKTLPDETFEQRNFDEYGRLESYVTRAGDEISIAYDDLGRVIEKSPDGMPTILYEHDLAGRLRKASTPVVLGNPSSGVFEYFYDSVGRLVKEKLPDGKEVSYQLDSIGNITRLTYPDNYFVERVYDELNRLTDIKLNGAVTSAVSFDYDALSRRRKITYENGTETDYGLEIDDDLTSLIHNFVGSSVEFSYTFNSAHELQSQSVDDNSYLWHPVEGSTVAYGMVNNLNQYPSVGGDDYFYNSNGCLIDNDVWQFGYDTQNQLVSATNGVVIAEYVYDPQGRQTQRVVDGLKTRFIHSGQNIIAEYDDVGDFSKRFVYGSGQNEVLIELDDSDNPTYYHHDRIGSVVATTDDTGEVLQSYAYSPWGECEDLSGATFGFQGQRFDHETGLYFMKARHYDPKIGRFLQPDPIGFGDGLNMYQFAYNNPLTFTDPFGLSADGSNGASSSSGTMLQGYVSNDDPMWTIEVEYEVEWTMWTTPMGFDGNGNPEVPITDGVSVSYSIGVLDALSMSYLGDFMRNPQQALSDWSQYIDAQIKAPDPLVQVMEILASIGIMLATFGILGQLLKSFTVTVKPPLYNPPKTPHPVRWSPRRPNRMPRRLPHKQPTADGIDIWWGEDPDFWDDWGFWLPGGGGNSGGGPNFPW